LPGKKPYKSAVPPNLIAKKKKLGKKKPYKGKKRREGTQSLGKTDMTE